MSDVWSDYTLLISIHQRNLLYNNLVIAQVIIKANTTVGVKANTAVFIRHLQIKGLIKALNEK